MAGIGSLFKDPTAVVPSGLRGTGHDGEKGTATGGGTGAITGGETEAVTGGGTEAVTGGGAGVTDGRGDAINEGRADGGVTFVKTELALAKVSEKKALLRKLILIGY